MDISPRMDDSPREETPLEDGDICPEEASEEDNQTGG